MEPLSRVEAKWESCPLRHPRFRRCPCLSTASIISTPSLFQPGQFAPGFSLAHSEVPSGAARGERGRERLPARAASAVHSRAAALPTSLPPSLCPSPRHGWGPGEPGPPSWPPAATAPARRPCPASLRRSSASYPRCRSLSSRPPPQAFPLPNRGFLIRKRVQRSPEQAEEKKKLRKKKRKLGGGGGRGKSWVN